MRWRIMAVSFLATLCASLLSIAGGGLDQQVKRAFNGTATWTNTEQRRVDLGSVYLNFTNSIGSNTFTIKLASYVGTVCVTNTILTTTATNFMSVYWDNNGVPLPVGTNDRVVINNTSNENAFVTINLYVLE